MADLYPQIPPYRTSRLRVSSIHELNVEEYGNPAGLPVIFFHGGPGAGISSLHPRFFDPSFYRVVIFDQRGSGKRTKGTAPIGAIPSVRVRKGSS